MKRIYLLWSGHGRRNSGQYSRRNSFVDLKPSNGREVDRRNKLPNDQKVVRRNIEILNFIREGGKRVERRFSEVLRLFWEGVLFEYLRSVGYPLRDAQHDPRLLVIRYWRRSLLDPRVRSGFIPYYLKREVKNREAIISEDKDVGNIRKALLRCEDAVKGAEIGVRRHHDYRFVLRYFSASRELHHTLVDSINYLVNEVEQLRAQVDHCQESISIMKEQLIELETKYDSVVGGLVFRGAFQVTTENILFKAIVMSHADLRRVRDAVRQLLSNMELGPLTLESFLSGDSHLSGGAPSIDTVCVEADICDSTPMQTAQNRIHGKAPAEEDKEEMMPWIDSSQPRHHPLPRHHVDGHKEHSFTCGKVATAASVLHTTIGEDVTRVPSCNIGNDLTKVRAIHNISCRRYASCLTGLVEVNGEVSARAAETDNLRNVALKQASQWEERCRMLQEDHEAMRHHLEHQVAIAEERATEAYKIGFRAEGKHRDALEGAIPILLQMIRSFVPLDPEVLGVDLCQTLGVNPDHYVHIVSAKRMLEGDLESRAYEVFAAEQEQQLLSEEKEAEITLIGSPKKGRGRPRSKGKASQQMSRASKPIQSRGKSPRGKRGDAVDDPAKGKKHNDLSSEGKRTRTNNKEKHGSAASSVGKSAGNSRGSPRGPALNAPPRPSSPTSASTSPAKGSQNLKKKK